jgi:protein TonB
MAPVVQVDFAAMTMRLDMRDVFAQYGPSATSLTLVLLAHLVAIASALWLSSADNHQMLELPTVQGVIIPAPPAEKIVPPVIARPPEPLPVEQPKPKPKPKPRPLPKKLPPAPPSERAVSKPPEPALEPPAPAPAEPAQMPVTPPRVDASQLKNPAPPYPSLSRRLREEGTVVLELLILADGTVGEIRVQTSSGFPRLDQSALETVRYWKFVPARRGNEAIAYTYLQPLEFSLNQ